MAGTTTVRITAAGKRHLERLAQKLGRARGRKATLQEVLESGLGFLVTHEAEFLKSPEWRPLTPAEIEEVLALPAKLGGWTGSWEDIDAIVYDDP